MTIVMESGSTRRFSVTFVAPATIQSPTVTTWVRSSGACDSISSSPPAAIANAAAMAAVENHPVQRPSRRPTSMFTAAASSGMAITRPKRSIIPGARPLHRRRSMPFAGTPRR